MKALSKQWRDIGLSVTLNASVMEQHIVPFNNKYGLGDKKESYIESGHQIGIKENHRHQGMTNFQKKMEASLKAQTIPTHQIWKKRSRKISSVSIMLLHS